MSLFQKLGAAVAAGPRLRSVKPPVKSSWEMRTNIKARPGSQGTLFQGGADQMTAAKWPKHYTPERLHQVLPIVAPSKILLRDDPASPVDTAPDRRKLIDTIARSTVPVEHLLGVQFSPGREMIEMAQPSGDLAAGSYHPRELSAWGSKAPQIQIAESESDTSTPIHEIGHHASQRFGSVSLDTPEERGHEEGLADNYAREHYRDRRGRPEWVPTYAHGVQSEQRPAAFYNSYHNARGNPAEYDLAHAVRADMNEDAAYDFANPQLPFPDPPAHSFNDTGSRRGEYY